MAGLPKIEINFKQLATTLIQRSERGTAILLLDDTTSEEIKTKVYKTVADIDESLYTEENLKYIKMCMAFAPFETVVISSASEKFSDFASEIMKIRNTGWIAFAGLDAPQADLASWIKSMEKQGNTYKAIGTISGQDCKHYVYFNQKCYGSDGYEFDPDEYIPSLLGIVASCNINRGCTNFLCTNISRVEEVEDAENAVKAGQLVLKNDVGGVRIAVGINSLTTLDGNTSTEDMQYIETVEAMDLISDDIKSVFKTTYQGSYKNKYKNQLLFIGSVNQYYESLAAEDILDEEYDNIAEIDVEAQRSAWVGAGNTDAEDWDDDTVKKMSFKRSVFIANNIKILNCMENLKFEVTLE